MSKSAAAKPSSAMDPPPLYDVSLTASRRNSSDSIQLDQVEAETEPLTAADATTTNPPACKTMETAVERGQHTGGFCNIMSDDGCCNWESTGGCCNYRYVTAGSVFQPPGSVVCERWFHSGVP